MPSMPYSKSPTLDVLEPEADSSLELCFRISRFHSSCNTAAMPRDHWNFGGAGGFQKRLGETPVEDRLCRCAVQPQNWYHREPSVKQECAVGCASVCNTALPYLLSGQPQFTLTVWKLESSAPAAYAQALLLTSRCQPDESGPGLGGSDAARTPRAPLKQLGGGARRRRRPRPGCRSPGGPQGGTLGLRSRAGRTRSTPAANVSPGDAATGGERGAAATVRTADSERTRVSESALGRERAAPSGAGGAGPRRPGGCRGRGP